MTAAGQEMHHRWSRGRAIGIMTATAAGLLLSACSGAVIETEASAPVSFGCIDDSKQCIDQRQSTLKSLLADKSRKWVKEPATTGAYASGVRLWAFNVEKPRLSCEELAIGRREAANAPGALRGPSGQGLPTAVVARSVIFADEVGKKLGQEAQRRCKA